MTNETVRDDIPLRLDRAVELAFPEGGLTKSALQTEIRRGRLQASRIGGKDFVTLAAIREMLEKCRVQPKAHDFISMSEPKPISSETDRHSTALGALLANAEKLKESLQEKERTKREDMATIKRRQRGK